MLQWTTSDSDNNPDGASWYGLGQFTPSGDHAWVCLSNYWGLSFRARDTDHVKINGNVVINAGNYTSYTVKKDGTGASGTWGINVTGSAGSVAWGNVSGKPTILKVWEGSVKFSGGSASLSSTLGSSAQIYSCTFNNLGNMGPIIFGCVGANLLAIILQINGGNLVYHNYSGTVTVRVIYA